MGKRKKNAKNELKPAQPGLSQLESDVMDVLWDRQQATAEDVRLRLAKTADQPLKDSTIRTILRRVEEKGYAEHDVDGRTFIYHPKVDSSNVATSAVRGIIDRFCGGSVENLLVGLVDDKVVSPAKLKQLAQRISEAEANEKKGGK